MQSRSFCGFAILMFMEELNFWETVEAKLKLGQKVAVLLVTLSNGSSPGRQGHKMMVAEDASMFGTIGGGAMEYKLVEKRKKQLHTQMPKVLWQRLVHDPSVGRELWSGLSCVGEQVVISYFLDATKLSLVQKIISACKSGQLYSLTFKSDGQISLDLGEGNSETVYNFRSEEDWSYRYVIGIKERFYIIGAGHVGLALCKQFSLLDYHVTLIDNRPDLSTEGYESYYQNKIITSYKNVAEVVSCTKHDFIISLTFSRALDILVLSQLIDKPFRYFGLMASQSKANAIHKSILEQGFAPELLERIHMPIGFPIQNDTPAEIAVSITAQIIDIRNGGKG
ncbi:MAG: XdhC family protein [Aureispira sp.]|nr:XdhC family protein [Aureispira sp.]